MKIEKLNDLKKLLQLCREQGVEAMEIDGIKFNLGRLPASLPDVDKTAFPEATIKVPAYDGPITPPEEPKTDGLTEDQLMFYSAQGHSEVHQ